MTTQSAPAFDLPALRQKLETEESKVFYKDVEMICNDCVEEWDETLETNVLNGLPFLDLFTFSTQDSVFVIKIRGETETKTYDICEQFVNDKTRKTCREYKTYTFFNSKNFSKYITTTFGTDCKTTFIPVGTDTFVVRLYIK